MLNYRAEKLERKETKKFSFQISPFSSQIWQHVLVNDVPGIKVPSMKHENKFLLQILGHEREQGLRRSCYKLNTRQKSLAQV